MKIALLEPLRVSEKLIEELAQPLRAKGHEFVYYNEKTTDSDELYSRSRDADIVMIANTSYPEEVISRLEKTQLINIAFTGIDHVDKQAADRRGIKLANAAGYSDQSVAELVLGLTLDVYRSISRGDSDVKKAENFPGLIQGREIRGKTVGIIGTGQIGLKTAQLFKAFGAELIGFSRSQKEEAKQMGLEYTSLDDVLSRSDIVSVHLPMNEQTKGFVSEEKLKLMKSDAVLINCARGPIVDNKALATLLNTGEIAGAGIDVFDREAPLPADYPLLSAQNTVLTPHVAYLTDEAMEARARIVFNNTLAYLEGHPENIVE
ncbi:D-3-phosphoglycerate dehydrogenase [Alkalibacterium sp. AK22]|uniref:2-hydroxyacid dehydrogenase n=1 Tax=Alkalibacterium sp. AK22 TaxID=1229520 RepID=UPI00044CD872|nr:2-hydroxyacid dehydrogenase [Alkalibacterium sp. AK22]EXJ23049.1 D-3-phosphoglycerate dehydrogenase [Alkalibacterium sp. AK22]